MKNLLMVLGSFLFSFQALAGSTTTLSADELSVATAAKILLVASQAKNKIIHLKGNFGALNNDGTYTGEDVSALDHVAIYYSSGLHINVMGIPQQDLTNISVDGQPLVSLVNEPANKLSNKDVEFFGDLLSTLKLSMAGSIVHLQDKSGVATGEGTWSGTSQTNIVATAVALEGNTLKFDLIDVWQKDFSALSIDGVPALCRFLF